MKHTAKILAIIAITALPAAATAGAYGKSAVKDASVSNSGASGGSVWCDRVEANVPERLAADMNCGGAVVARPRGLRGFFANLGGGNKTNPDRDNDNNDVVRRPLPEPTVTASEDPDDPTPTTPGDPTPPTDTPTDDFVSKADRLSEYGTTFDTIGEMSPEFQADVREYREEHGGNGNWSGFESDG